jgi:hypothetical protein
MAYRGTALFYFFYFSPHIKLAARGHSQFSNCRHSYMMKGPKYTNFNKFWISNAWQIATFVPLLYISISMFRISHSFHLRVSIKFIFMYASGKIRGTKKCHTIKLGTGKGKRLLLSSPMWWPPKMSCILELLLGYIEFDTHELVSIVKFPC